MGPHNQRTVTTQARLVCLMRRAQIRNRRLLLQQPQVREGEGVSLLIVMLCSFDPLDSFLASRYDHTADVLFMCAAAQPSAAEAPPGGESDTRAFCSPAPHIFCRRGHPSCASTCSAKSLCCSKHHEPFLKSQQCLPEVMNASSKSL